MDVGPLEIALVVLVIVILFGAKKLPELARSLGRSSSEFKKGMREGASEDEDRAVPDPRTEPRSNAGTATRDELPPSRSEDRPA
jgi:sec-independent protein translocase protein TatA